MTGSVTLLVDKPIEHAGIAVDLIGVLEIVFDRSHTPFLHMTRSLAVPGKLGSGEHSMRFEFVNPELTYEAYSGQNVHVRYYVRLTVQRTGLASSLNHEEDFFVHTYSEAPALNPNIRQEVGIERALHLEIELVHSRYPLRTGVIVGKVFFLLVRLPIRHMELALICRESVGSGSSQVVDSMQITKFELMDGSPVRGESIPIRFFLGGFELPPTMNRILKLFSLRYFLNVVLVDAEDRRYFKQHEIILYREAPAAVAPAEALAVAAAAGATAADAAGGSFSSGERARLRHDGAAGSAAAQASSASAAAQSAATDATPAVGSLESFDQE